MPITGFIKDHTILVGFFVVGVFSLWKFILQPIMNEGQPIEPPEEDKEENQFSMFDNQ